MINKRDNYVEWALLLTELDEAAEHLKALIDEMAQAGRIEESEYAIQLGHVFAHMNRAWHARRLAREMSKQEFAEFSRFPEDLEL